MKLNSLLPLPGALPDSCHPQPWARPARLLLAGLAALLTLAVRPARAQSSAYFQPDSALTRRAFQLCQGFSRPAWNSLAATLWAKPHPVWSYLYYGQRTPRHLLVRSYVFPLRYTRSFHQAGAYFSSPPAAVRQLTRRLDDLGLERRLADYEQLSQLLLTRATKVRRIREAVPLLVLRVDSAGYVKNVAVDRTRTHVGLTTRSRKIILQTLRDNDFRVREAYDYFQQPRPFHEKLVAARYQLGAASRSAGRFLFGWALYHKAKRTQPHRRRRHDKGTYRSS